MPSIVVMGGKSAGTVFDLSQGETFEVGTARKAYVHLRDRGVSYLHAKIVRRGEAFVLQDSGSPNGTSVNKEKLTTERELRPGDVIAFGETEVRFDLAAPLPNAPVARGTRRIRASALTKVPEIPGETPAAAPVAAAASPPAAPAPSLEPELKAAKAELESKEKALALASRESEALSQKLRALEESAAAREKESAALLQKIKGLEETAAKREKDEKERLARASDAEKETAA
ncbi:FHA domain-containing protein, partial [bacterium]|nr:FHA domain-containing protein [bacterium]